MHVNTVLLAIIQNAQCKYCTTGHTECITNTVLLAIIQNAECKYVLLAIIQNALYYWQSYRMHNVNTVLLAII